jgi:hypothetical protein
LAPPSADSFVDYRDRVVPAMNGPSLKPDEGPFKTVERRRPFDICEPTGSSVIAAVRAWQP